MKAVPAPAQMSIKPSDGRSRKLYLFWTDTISATLRARNRTAAETFETPIKRILPSSLKVNEGTDRILDRHAVIDGMELVVLDPLESQPPQTVRTSATEMFRPAIDVPIAGDPGASARPYSLSRAPPDKDRGPR
jgi:hypothetical protein